LACEHSCACLPRVFLTLPPEVCGNAALTDHLRALGVTAFIDDSPRPEVAALVDDIVRAHVAQRRIVKRDVACATAEPSPGCTATRVAAVARQRPAGSRGATA